MKLKDNSWLNLTKLDFLENIWFPRYGVKMGQKESKGVKNRVFQDFLENGSWDLSDTWHEVKG